MKDVMDQIKKIAPTDTIVLILGDTGVGKGEVARQIYAQSKRADKVLFNADCTSIPESLVESELFGYAPGAFSGAKREGKPGYFELAEEGELFLMKLASCPFPCRANCLASFKIK